MRNDHIYGDPNTSSRKHRRSIPHFVAGFPLTYGTGLSYASPTKEQYPINSIKEGVMRTKRFFLSVAVVIALSFLSQLPATEAWAAYPEPGRVIRLVLPFPPGGNTDIISRALGNELSTNLGVPVVLDFRPGAGGALGSAMVAGATPDGYTILMVAAGHVINPSMIKKLSYDTIKDFAPISMVADVPSVLVVHPSVQANNLKELIALAKARPGQLNFATSGYGTIGHLSGELLKSMAQVKMEHVPYKGSGPAMIEMVGGHVQLMFSSMPAAMPHIQSGKLRAIAMTGAVRSPAAPDIPTMAESGLPGFVASTGFGLLAPAKTPREIINKIHGELVKALRVPMVRERLASMGADPVGSTPDEYDVFIRSEVAKWIKVVTEAGIQPI
jgi:tripartite-type tricarboxylate transporter receptor subunit TctC